MENKLKKLIHKYLNGSANSAERYLVETWLESFQRDHHEVPDFEQQEYIQGFKNEVVSRVEEGTLLKKSKSPFKLWIYSVSAACLIGVLGISYVYFKPQDTVIHEPAVPSYRVETGIGQVKQLLLPDSTVVLLNANSTLEVEQNYGVDQRVVHLNGEGFFDVKRDSLRPFQVKMSRYDVMVLGTRFNVLAYEDNPSIRVDVQDGLVEVQGRDTMLTRLGAKEFIHIDQFGQVRRGKLPIYTASSWEDGIITLQDASFDRLSQVFFNSYGYMLESKDTSVLNQAFNLTVRSNRTLEQTLEQIGKMLNKKYRKEGGRIIIY